MRKKRASESLAVKMFQFEHPLLTSYVFTFWESYNDKHKLKISFSHECGDKQSGLEVALPVPKKLLSDDRFDEIAVQLLMSYITRALPNMMLFAASSIVDEAAWLVGKKLGVDERSEEEFVERRMSISNDVLRRRLRMRRRGNESLWNDDELVEVVRAALSKIKQLSRLNYNNAAEEISKLHKDKLEGKLTGNALRAMLYRREIDWKKLKNERKKEI